MRLIDADELERKVSRLCHELSTPDGTGANDGLVFAAQDILIDVMQEIHDTPTIAPPPNDPLTLEELREMEYGPLWIIEGKLEHWALCEPLEGKSGIWCIDQYGDGDLPLKDYGVGWLAYRRKTEVDQYNE